MSPPLVTVELVKAADIKVIAALGDSLTVGVLLLAACHGKCAEIFMANSCGQRASWPSFIRELIALKPVKFCGLLALMLAHAGGLKF